MHVLPTAFSLTLNRVTVLLVCACSSEQLPVAVAAAVAAGAAGTATESSLPLHSPLLPRVLTHAEQLALQSKMIKMQEELTRYERLLTTSAAVQQQPQLQQPLRRSLFPSSPVASCSTAAAEPAAAAAPSDHATSMEH